MVRLAYACVLTRDIARLAAFYRAVFQTEAQWTGQYAEFPTSGGVFSLWSLDAYVDIAGAGAVPTLGSGGVMLEFEVPDVDAEFGRLQGLAEFKIEFIISPTTMPWGNRSIYFRDPDGNMLNVFSHVRPS